MTHCQGRLERRSQLLDDGLYNGLDRKILDVIVTIYKCCGMNLDGRYLFLRWQGLDNARDRLDQFTLL